MFYTQFGPDGRHRVNWALESLIAAKSYQKIVRHTFHIVLSGNDCPTL